MEISGGYIKNDFKIRKYSYPEIKAYKIDGTFLNTFYNDVELLMFQVDTLRLGISDQFYLMWNDNKIMIDKMANLSQWPKGMFDRTGVEYSELFKLRKELYSNSK